MKISVVIPLYNKGPYIVRALRSVAAQTFADFECIVVDDGSKDDSLANARNFTDPRFQIVTQANGGPGSARNHGLKLATGEFIAFLDADDAWHPTFLERAVSLLGAQGNNVGCISMGYRLFPGARSTEGLWRNRGLSDGVHRIAAATSPQFVVHLLAFLTPVNTLARTELLRRLGGFYEKDKCRYGEDAYLWLKVLLNASVMVNLEPLVDVHTDASGLSHNLKTVRPIEPLLTDPTGLVEACPEALRPLLHEVLSMRAMRTACVMSYWGKWRIARGLLKQFVAPSLSTRFLMAQSAATPLGALFGNTVRAIRRPVSTLC